MNRRRNILLALVVAGVGCGLHWWPDRGPVYQGRRTADWVEEAFKDPPSSEAFDAVLKIGAPAVPFIARGLHDRCHSYHFLSAGNEWYFIHRHPRLGRLLEAHVEICTGKHLRASWLLWRMGTNAQAAIPDVIDCLENCPSLHFISAWEMLGTLEEISGTNPAAIPYLTECARGGDSCRLRAAVAAYRINGQTNLLIETCERLSRIDPAGLLDGLELFWFKDDPELNQHLVPLLEKLYLDPKLDARDRSSAMAALELRTNAAAAVVFCARFHEK